VESKEIQLGKPSKKQNQLDYAASQELDERSVSKCVFQPNPNICILLRKMLEAQVPCSNSRTSSNTGIRPEIINTQTGITRDSWNNTEETIFTAPTISRKEEA
jgi:hypothetical protein